jgi:protein gp37
MSEKTGIGWTQSTWSPITGCSRVSEGCTRCYAESLTATKLKNHPRYAGLAVLKNGEARWTGEIRCHEDQLDVPLHWRKPRMVFVNSMSDTFHEKVPDLFIRTLFKVMGEAKQHTFQILTKRPERMAAVTTEFQREGDFATLDGEDGLYPFPNVWLGTSCEDQATADERIPHLLRCPAAVRFLSLEPLLGPIKIGDGDGCEEWWQSNGIGWVIAGGESGPGHRQMKLEWLESIVEQCKAAGVPVFVKQDAGPRPGMQGRIPDRLWIKEFPTLCNSPK